MAHDESKMHIVSEREICDFHTHELATGTRRLKMGRTMRTRIRMVQTVTVTVTAAAMRRRRKPRQRRAKLLARPFFC